MSRRKRLRPDRPEDETFRFMLAEWNVSQAMELAAEMTPQTATISGVFGILDFVAIYPEIVEKADLSFPILVVQLPGNLGMMVIDGWHRIAKAKAEGKEELPAFLLDKAQESLIRIRPSRLR